MTSSPYYNHPVIQMLARAGGWPALLQSGQVFDAVAVPTSACLQSDCGRWGYLPVFDSGGESIRFMQFIIVPLDPPIFRVAEALSQGSIVELHSSPLALRLNKANLADAVPMMRMAKAYHDILGVITAGRRFDIRDMPLTTEP